jgi:hypothetical protein
MAYWYTYSIPLWETELEQIEDEMEKEHREECVREIGENAHAHWLFEQKMDLYEDMGQIGSFLKFAYHYPSVTTEEVWCTPDFRARDPMGLFYRLLDRGSFRSLRRIFHMKRTAYQAEGKAHYTRAMLVRLLEFAERWCIINRLYYEDDTSRNYKVTLWVASRMMIFLNE